MELMNGNFRKSNNTLIKKQLVNITALPEVPKTLQDVPKSLTWFLYLPENIQHIAHMYILHSYTFGLQYTDYFTDWHF